MLKDEGMDSRKLKELSSSSDEEIKILYFYFCYLLISNVPSFLLHSDFCLFIYSAAYSLFKL